MRTSGDVDQLSAALSAAQAEFEAVDKNATNPFFHSNYADLPAVVKATSPILAKHGLAVTQLPDWDGTADLLTTRIMHSSGQWLEASMRLGTEPQKQGSAITYGRRYAYSGGLGLVTEADDDGEATRKVGRTRSQPPVDPSTGEIRNGSATDRPSTSRSASRTPARSQPPTAAPEAHSATPGGQTMTVDQRGKLMAAFGDLGIGGDREARLDYCKVITGREVRSTTELTKDEASAVIDALVRDVEAREASDG